MWEKMGAEKDQLLARGSGKRELLLAKVKQSVAETAMGKAGRSPVNTS